MFVYCALAAQVHFAEATREASAPVVTSLSKAAGGFVSGGSDGTLRVWAAADGAPHKCLQVSSRA